MKEVISFDEADEYQRVKYPIVLGVCVLVFLFMMYFFIEVERDLLGAVLFSGVSLVTILYLVAHALKLWVMGGSRQAWRRVGDGIGFFPPISLRIVAMTPAFATIATAAIMIYLDCADSRQQLVAAYSDTGHLRIFFFALVLLVVGLADLFSILVTFFGLPVVFLTPRGVTLRSKFGRTVFVEWEECPEIVGATRRRVIVVATVSDPGIRVPMADIPLAYGRIQQLLEFYARNAGRRVELDSDGGLERVKRLMVQYAWEVEESLG